MFWKGCLQEKAVAQIHLVKKHRVYSLLCYKRGKNEVCIIKEGKICCKLPRGDGFQKVMKAIRQVMVVDSDRLPIVFARIVY